MHYHGMAQYMSILLQSFCKGNNDWNDKQKTLSVFVACDSVRGTLVLARRRAFTKETDMTWDGHTWD